MIESKDLFSTGPGGRHDWMRFHSGDVDCPDSGCVGQLRWEDGKRTTLKCSICKQQYSVRKKHGRKQTKV